MARVRQWFKGRFRRKIPEVPEDPRLRRSRLARLERIAARIGRVIKTSRGGINMPKRQPCPQCGGWRKRIEKLVGGANYRCNTCHLMWFVRHS